MTNLDSFGHLVTLLNFQMAGRAHGRI